ncbi:MAG: extracellular solute-binding protein [Defluviitaleaceae bacterium]|nr:extracellular solute-binding protein [Defluviitaleaceae bacterium]
MKLVKVGKHSVSLAGRRLICVILALALSMGSFGYVARGAEETAPLQQEGQNLLDVYLERLAAFGSRYHFTHYLYDHAGAPRPVADYIINAEDYILVEGMEIEYLPDFEGMPGISVLTDEQGLIEWEVTVAESGLYNISVLYYSIEGRSSDIQRAVFINGQQPFFEANPIELRRTWVNRLDYIQRDAHGNDMRPTQVEQHRWYEALLRDAMGTYNEPFVFYLEAGRNTIGFVSQREPVVIRHLRVHQAPVVLSYAEVSAQQAGLPKPTAAQVAPIRIEGQDAVRKSSPMLAPQSDTGGPGVYPYSARYIRVNNIGGGSWSEPGSWIEWEVNVPEAGLYKIALNVRQNLQRGASAVRRITINGEVPFSEMEGVNFPFQGGWRMDVLGGEDDPYLFWLEAGYNTIRMEAVLGDYAPLVREVQESAQNLNALYRQIRMIIGHAPDRWRDYRIGARLPHLEAELRYERARLERIFEELTEIAVGRGERDAVIRNMARTLSMLYRDLEEIPQRTGDFQINIAALGTWVMVVREQGLAVESIHILPYDAPVPSNGRSWWRQILHEVLTLFWSFFIDYNSIGSANEDGVYRHVEVWIAAGRDQANVIKGLIDETFTPQTGIGVSFKLVDMGTLLPATVAGQGPDVALNQGANIPIDFATRGAVADLSGFPGFDEVIARFSDAAITPFQFEGQTFALPETLTFPMLFYRRDILHEIGLEPPETWDEVRSAIAHMAPHHMEFGLPIVASPVVFTEMTYTIFLYQHGGTWYNHNATRSALDEDVAVNAFRDFTRFFTDYQLPRDFSFVNRFRAGDMPMAVVDYTTYNMLQVFAPEIRGLWGFRPIPGILMPDGTINNMAPSGGSAVIMMEDADDKYAAWDFMKWWTDAETQVQFGRRMESLMGSAARHPTANMEAFSRMPWPVAHYQSLRAQMENIQGIPQVPGGYFTPRQVRNAFYTVVELENVGPREALTDAVRLINDEIRVKRREFGLDY